MDAVNAALWTLFTEDAGLQAALGPQSAEWSKGVWHMEADEAAPLPLVRFRLILPDYDYTYGGLSSVRLVYEALGFAEDTEAKTGKQQASELAGLLFAAALDADLAVAGHDVELCRPTTGVPPGKAQGPQGRTQFYEGVLIEIVLTPAT